MMIDEEKDYIAYEYKEIAVQEGKAPMYLDCYEAFGWDADEKFMSENHSRLVTLRLKRGRKIVNKAELNRLQGHFESCAREIETLEKKKNSPALLWALVIGLIGTAFMAGATFAMVHQPPMIPVCILLAVPGFIGWMLPYFLYHRILNKNTRKIQPMIEEKQEEIYQICEKGHALL